MAGSWGAQSGLGDLAMWKCRICGFECVLDDVELDLGSGHCVCLRCYLKQTGHAETATKQVRKDAGEAASGLS